MQDTIDSYNETYRAFTKYYDEQNPCSSLNVDVMNGFILYMKRRGTLNDMSINSHLKNMRAFINFCAGLGYLEEFKVQLLTTEKPIKETYSDKEIAVLLRKPNIKKCSFVEYRNWVFINYLLATGNRVSTIINIKIRGCRF